MKKIAIFILSIPILALAIAWVPLGIVVDLVVAPIYLPLMAIYALRGEWAGVKIFLVIPTMVFQMYAEITGFGKEIADKFDRWTLDL